MRALAVFLTIAALLILVASAKAPPIRAIFKALVRHRHDDGRDDTEDLQLDYTEETKKHMPEIIKERVSELVSRYCGDVSGALATFSVEYAPLLGVHPETVDEDVLNVTHPDAYDISIRLLTIFKAFAQRRPYINASLASCEGAATNVTEDRHRALWQIGCMSTEMRTQEANHTRSRLYREWDTGPSANEAFRALGEIMACPHDMTRLALVQLDTEYKRDGIRQAEIAGKMSKERMDAVIEKLRIPNYAEYRVAASPIAKDNTQKTGK